MPLTNIEKSRVLQVDGDICFTTNYEAFIQGKVESKPILYDALVAEKENIEDQNKVLVSQANGFGTKVGFLTNVGSTMVTMLYDLLEGTPAYDILNNRYKFIRTAQGYEIDKQKGLIIPPFPVWWTKKKKDDDEITQKLVVDKRPYFFRYLYEHMNRKMRRELDVYENISRTVFGKSFTDIHGNYPNNNDEENVLVEQYRKYSSFIDNNSLMNRVSHYMENEIQKMKKKRRELGANFKYEKITSVNFIKPNKNEIEKIKLLFKEYKSLKRALRENMNEYDEKNYSTLDQIKKYINNKAYETISSNSEELGNLAVYLCYEVLGETSRVFCWDCFGKEIVDNIRTRKTDRFVRVPVKKNDGNIDYLFSRYGNYLMNIGNQ